MKAMRSIDVRSLVRGVTPAALAVVRCATLAALVVCLSDCASSDDAASEPRDAGQAAMSDVVVQDAAVLDSAMADTPDSQVARDATRGEADVPATPSDASVADVRTDTVVESGTAVPSDASSAVASACSARSGMRACQEFETFAAGPLPSSGIWSAQVNGEGTVLIDDSTPAHSGRHSLRVHGAGFSTFAVFHDASVLPSADQRFYLRAFVRLAEAMSAGHNTFVIADQFAKPGEGNAARIGEMNAMLMMTVGGDSHGALSHDNYYSDHMLGVQFAPNRWTCLELLFDAAHPEIDVWVDGVNVPDMHKTTWPVDNYDALRFGFEKYAGPVSDVWYDDVAVGSERIGCQ